MNEGNEWTTYFWPQVKEPEVCLTEPPETWSTGSIITDSRGNRMKIDDSVMNAAIRLRAIYHNREAESSFEAQREWDTRTQEADIQLEAALLGAGMMDPKEVLESIEVDYDARTITCTFACSAPDACYVERIRRQVINV